MFISNYFIEFIIYSFIGWIWECCYCTYSEHKWQNRGFLYGPVIPIYGAGAVGASILFTHIPGLKALMDSAASTKVNYFFVFLICALASAVLEYLTSYFLEKRFHARWWDYSDMPLNINGRVCLPATILFGVAELGAIKYILPLAQKGEALLPDYAAELIALILMAVLAADTALTVANLTQILEKLDAIEGDFNEAMETGYQAVSNTPAYIKAKGEKLVQQAEAIQSGWEDRIGQFKRSLTVREKYAVRNIRRFSSQKANLIISKLSEMVDKEK